MVKSKLPRLLVAALCTLLISPAPAQLSVEITGAGAKTVPIAVANFAGPEQAREFSAILRADLGGSEAFRLVDAGDVPLPETTATDYEAWREIGADVVLLGSLGRAANGQLRVTFLLHDAVRGAVMGGLEILTEPDAVRSAAHRVANHVYEMVTGIHGIFGTRLAYVAKRPGRYELHIADASGGNPQIALASWQPVISPAWAPDGKRLAYVSFESKKPVVYVHSLTTGTRTVLANFRGSNSAPAWSPDGKRLAVVLTKDGTSRLYTIDADGSRPKALAEASGIDTEPCFSPDGEFIYFTSDRGGTPQIYRIPSAGGGAERMTFEGDYNVSPRVSPDGSVLALITRTEKGFQLAALDIATKQVRLLTDSVGDESPSFAPNGRLIAVATTNGERGILSVVSADGRFRKQLAIEEGDLREPAWSPYLD